MEKESVIISEGNRPLWQIILAAFFFTCSFVAFGYFFYYFKFSVKDKVVEVYPGLLELAGMCFFGGIGFSVKSTKYFDLVGNKYKNVLSIGPFKDGKWTDLPQMEYVSVFRDSEEIFSINIWYNKNKHFNIYTYHDKETALEMGYHVAKSLGIKLFDATVANKNRFLKMEELNEKYNKSKSSN